MLSQDQIFLAIFEKRFSLKCLLNCISLIRYDESREMKHFGPYQREKSVRNRVLKTGRNET
jgi:hypothetical protein